ncbi:FtsX-like permease family protein [Salinithrix halophila]|uniref:FtsX-like permease family protein n=1 Tax=Salinithrix halophila TaxID=1485204 RepID=A0ABV8JF10_9BACL
MTFPRFAFNNVRRNFHSYLAYCLSSAFAVMVFFTYALFIFHPDIDQSEMSKTVAQGMKAAEYIIFVFSFLFVLYSVSAFLSVRKKEFGILTIHGVTRGQLNRLVFLENLFIGALSVGGGIVAGLLFSKGFLIVGADVLGLKKLPFYFPVKAMLLTVCSFFPMFFVISLATVFLVRNNRVIELLQGSKKPKKEPKASILLSLLSAACLVGGYGLAIVVSDQYPGEFEQWMLPIIGLTTVGTYFLYTQASVALIRLTKKRRRFYRRGVRLLWLSDLTYRMEDNARMFFLVTMVSTVAFSATGALLSQFEVLESQAKFYPYTFDYTFDPTTKKNQAKGESDLAVIEKELDRAGVRYQKVRADRLYGKLSSPKFPDIVGVLKLSQYQKMAKALKQKPRTLEPGQALLIDQRSEKSRTEQKIGSHVRLNKKSLSIADRSDQQVIAYQEPLTFVVPDRFYDQIKKDQQIETYIGYSVPEWKDSIPNPQAVKIAKGLKEKLKLETFDPSFSSPDLFYAEMKQGYGATLFVGLFIAVIFFVCAGSFLYFRLFTDLEREQLRYRAISKIGLTVEEMKRSAGIQIALLFFVPFGLAVGHTSVAFIAMQNMFPIESVLVPSLVTIGAFFLLQLIYFAMVRTRYLQNLKRAMVS